MMHGRGARWCLCIRGTNRPIQPSNRASDDAQPPEKERYLPGSIASRAGNTGGTYDSTRITFNGIT